MESQCLTNTDIPLQWTATAPRVFSHTARNRRTIASVGVLPSTKNKSRWSKPASVNRLAS